MGIEVLSYYDQYIEKIERNKKYGYDIEVSRNFLLSKAEPLHGNILEIGTGKGYLTVALAEKGYSLTSIDVSQEEQIFTCAVLAHFGLADNVKLLISDAKKTPLRKNSFDTIISCNALHHMGKIFPVIREMLRILKPQGKIVLGDFNQEGMNLIEKMHFSNGTRHDYETVNFNKVGMYLKDNGLKMEIFKDKLYNILIGYKDYDNRSKR